MRPQHGPPLSLDRQLRGIPEQEVFYTVPVLHQHHGGAGPGDDTSEVGATLPESELPMVDEYEGHTLANYVTYIK
jgi:hypothetical protein